MAAKTRAGLLHASFEIGILMKGIHALFELVSGALIWTLNPDFLRGAVKVLTRGELAEDPRDFFANLLLGVSQRYSIDTQQFWVLYLLSHGAVKLVLVLLLWKRKIWAYPLTVLTLVFFIAYQAVRWAQTHSAFLIALTLWDAIMIWLTIFEYRRLHAEAKADRAIERAR
jgi:uncharacterized membrane protein